ncbi:heavy metal translocating P-type ATPase [Staphylococcus sp. 17KM0847]|uniref:heavy metal translocating P-type ATPase n=1 Tax=Staphylococcus sp. 17KM0847 TaxID=2583989 RepID=UPI0015DCDE0F|nr:heavy metal translocating P-type ATPase [Staphylococcus sp. 17KM0847]QLK85903.1 heavy metal translocating P-type ATPase [Staphylococcus sp. 17KM0847]
MTKTKSTYIVEGMSCANCAAKFERNVSALPSVTSAQVNFAASKIYIEGSPTIEEIEQAGAFENIKVYSNNPKAHQKEVEKHSDAQNILQKIKSFYETHQSLCFATLLIVFGYLSEWIDQNTSLLTLLLFGSAIVISGASLLKQGIYNLIHLEFDMRTLMTVAVIGGALIGEWGEVAVVVILFALSEALEAFSMRQARQSMTALMAIAPDEATIIRQDRTIQIPVDEVCIGDILYVKTGQKIALDGKVKAGRAAVNQATITGESIPVEKSVGDTVYAGTLNNDGILEIEVTHTSENTTIAKVIKMVEDAQVEKAPAQAFIETFAKYYTPVIMGIAFLVMLIPPILFGGEWHTWVYQGLSVLVIGCPCALVISTPISIVSSISTAAKNGVLIKGGIYLEQLSKVKAMAFDKTGTLTMGEPEVIDVIALSSHDTVQDIMRCVYAVERRAQHPLARAMTAYIEQQYGTSHLKVTNFQAMTGEGIQADVEGQRIVIAKPDYFEAELTEAMKRTITEHQARGETVIVVRMNNTLSLLITVKDTVRTQSKAAIAQLAQLGITKRIMLTGDHDQTARKIAQELELTEVYANLLPKDKLKYIEKLEQQYQTVAMVGDGVNDAPALARAHVGISMGGASTDTALETADIALLSDEMSKLPFTYRLSRQTMRIIKANIAIAIGLKIIALLLVIPGWLTLWIAIMSDMGATLLVTLNAMRLLYVKEHTMD